MVASLDNGRQQENEKLSPSAALALVMTLIIVGAVFLTYRRAMVTHDFMIIDDTEENLDES